MVTLDGKTFSLRTVCNGSDCPNEVVTRLQDLTGGRNYDLCQKHRDACFTADEARFNELVVWWDDKSRCLKTENEVKQ